MRVEEEFSYNFSTREISFSERTAKGISKFLFDYKMSVQARFPELFGVARPKTVHTTHTQYVNPHREPLVLPEHREENRIWFGMFVFIALVVVLFFLWVWWAKHKRVVEAERKEKHFGSKPYM